ncbi:outer dense fiber of sperm tails 2 [Cichlidogyrus casuarinus]|uniref:Outer dense fiber of sperm tails 2 n=1 Tax=Cichlidogyrus casuarinus TaxID=1844966 RepID=A0ABD2Q4E5_9PLAT
MKRAARAHKRRADRLEGQLSGTMARLADSNASLNHVQTELESVNETRAQTSQLKQLKEKVEELERKCRENQMGMSTGMFPGAQMMMQPGMNPWQMGQAQQLATNSHNTGGAFDYLKEENEKLREAAMKHENKSLAMERDTNELKASLSSCEKAIMEQKAECADERSRSKVLQERYEKLEKEKEELQNQLEKHKNIENQRQRIQQASLLAATLGDTGHEPANFAGLIDPVMSTDAQLQLGKTLDQPTLSLGGTQLSYTGGVMRPNDQNKRRINELEVTTAELRKDVSKMRKERAELERRSNARLSELRLQLNQADVTNRSLHSYLTFLKRSYTSVFQTSANVNSMQGETFPPIDVPTARVMATRGVDGHLIDH